MSASNIEDSHLYITYTKLISLTQSLQTLLRCLSGQAQQWASNWWNPINIIWSNWVLSILAFLSILALMPCLLRWPLWHLVPGVYKLELLRDILCWLCVNSCSRCYLQSCEDLQRGSKEYALCSSGICRYLPMIIIDW